MDKGTKARLRDCLTPGSVVAMWRKWPWTEAVRRKGQVILGANGEKTEEIAEKGSAAVAAQQHKRAELRTGFGMLCWTRWRTSAGLKTAKKRPGSGQQESEDLLTTQHLFKVNPNEDSDGKREHRGFFFKGATFWLDLLKAEPSRCKPRWLHSEWRLTGCLVRFVWGFCPTRHVDLDWGSSPLNVVSSLISLS